MAPPNRTRDDSDPAAGHTVIITDMVCVIEVGYLPVLVTVYKTRVN